MMKRTLPRRAAASTWSHPYGHGPFSPFLYADGGDGDGTEPGSGDGADDDTGDSDDGNGADDAGDNAEGEAGEEKPKPKPPAKKDGDGDDSAATITRLQKELKAANGEAAKARTNAKKQAADQARTEIVQELGKALGLVKDDADEAPNPAKLMQQIESAQTAHRETAVELAVYRGASKHGADPDALTDSRSFLRSIKDLDPSDEGFGKAVSSAIKKAVEDNPKLKTAGQAPARTSGDFSGGSGKPSSNDSIEAHREARRKQRSG